MNKQFNFALCSADDLRTKKLVVEVLTECFGWRLPKPLNEQQEAYKDWDFQIEDRNGNTINVEVEFVNVWKESGKRPPNWPNFSVPLRKQKSKADFIFRVNHYGDTVAVTAMDAVRSSPKDYKATKNLRSGETTTAEPFFMVPFEKWRFLTKANGHWHQVDQFGNRIGN